MLQATQWSLQICAGIHGDYSGQHCTLWTLLEQTYRKLLNAGQNATLSNPLLAKVAPSEELISIVCYERLENQKDPLSNRSWDTGFAWSRRGISSSLIRITQDLRRKNPIRLGTLMSIMWSMPGEWSCWGHFPQWPNMIFSIIGHFFKLSRSLQYNKQL